MAGTPERRTLYEDWEARREQLAQIPYWTGDYHAVEVQILDYLLRRYRDTPEGNRPARAPLAHGVYVNHRAIVVMRHLGGGSIPTMTTAAEAQAHVQAVLQERLHKNRLACGSRSARGAGFGTEHCTARPDGSAAHAPVRRPPDRPRLGGRETRRGWHTGRYWPLRRPAGLAAVRGRASAGAGCHDSLHVAPGRKNSRAVRLVRLGGAFAGP